ncbi:MAG: polysaccharide pyruvyl transferase family protein [Propionibacteriaceae bacterium]|nr:polysaccharide pyruvyl transferase family protein [Propionibacteriaceae bacterium]
MLPPSTVVWGPGVNGKHLDLPLPPCLDVRAVRGPLTGRYLKERGITDPGVYGDPALLLRTDFTSAPDSGRVLLVPNLNDHAGESPPDARVIDPRISLTRFLKELSTAELVIGSSLHAIILAEKLGVPARAIRSGAEPTFKYEDYYEGTGRSGVRIARDARDALELGGVDAAPVLDPNLVATFPHDLWRSKGESAR